MKGKRDEATFWILHDSWTRPDHLEEMAHTMAQTSLNISDDVYCRVDNMLWWCLCMFENDVSCLMYDVGCWCILYIHKHIFRMIMQDDNGDGCGGCVVTLAEVLSSMIDWKYQRRRKDGTNRSHGPNRQLRTRAWIETWWTPAMWRHDGDGDIRYIFSEVTGLNRAISAGPPSTKIMLTMSLPMWRFRSTWKYQSN